MHGALSSRAKLGRKRGIPVTVEGSGRGSCAQARPDLQQGGQKLLSRPEPGKVFMSIALMSNAWKADLPPTNKLILLALCDWANDNGGSVHPSIETVAKKVGCSSRTVQRIIGELIECRWVAVVGNHFGGAPGQTRNYLMNVRQLRSAAEAYDIKEEADRRSKSKCGSEGSSHDDAFGVETGDMLSRVTSKAETGDICYIQGVTSTTETGDMGVTQSTIDPSVDPSVDPLRASALSNSPGLRVARKGRAIKAVAEALRPESVSESVWADFIAVRTAKRAPLTATAIAGIEREAAKAGVTIEAALQVCCERGWQSFRADWISGNAAGSARSARPPAGGLGGMTYGDHNGHFD